jgi:hypothetical protein
MNALRAAAFAGSGADTVFDFKEAFRSAAGIGFAAA